MTWTDKAKCKGLDTDLFFEPDRDEFPDRKSWLSERQRVLDNARTICAECPVAQECLTDNLNAPDGIFGGKSKRQRVKLARKLGKTQYQPRAEYQDLTEDRIALVKEYHRNGHSIMDISDLTGMERGYVSRIVNDKHKLPGTRFYQGWNNPEYGEVRALISQGLNAKHIERETGVHYKKIRRIRHSMQTVQNEEMSDA